MIAGMIAFQIMPASYMIWPFHPRVIYDLAVPPPKGVERSISLYAAASHATVNTTSATFALLRLVVCAAKSPE